MKFVSAQPYADPDAAARKLMEIANAIEPVQDGRLRIEKINLPFLRDGGTPAEYGAGLTQGNRARLALDAREQRLCEVHARRRYKEDRSAGADQLGRAKNFCPKSRSRQPAAI
jgi:hypothetical protein